MTILPGRAVSGSLNGSARIAVEERFSGSGNANILRKAVSEVHEKSEKKESFIAGDKVAHSKFGTGLVVSSQGKVITVIFDKAGTKKLAADIAPLKKIKE